MKSKVKVPFNKYRLPIAIYDLKIVLNFYLEQMD